ncbi:hypothetical protein A7982_13572 [Minicystis rosea]|nr:hypothetical protein A7982_13572 [Minicystis rosea]
MRCRTSAGALPRRGKLPGEMGKRLFLPLAVGEPAQRPTVDTVRRRLGGRASTESGAGEVVTFHDERGLERTGVVVFVRGDELFVWLEGDVVRRVPRAAARAADGVISEALLAVARDAQGFATLSEGQRVRYQHSDGLGEGALIEKCRFGALVERHDRTVLGIGFRRLWSV